MNLLDENIRHDQGLLLRRWRVPCRFLVEEFASSGIQDADIIPLLHRLKQPTLFTHDRDFFQRGLVHSAYCLVWLDVFSSEAAKFIRAFLKHEEFATAKQRLGTVARVHQAGVHFWQWNRSELQHVTWKKE